MITLCPRCRTMTALTHYRGADERHLLRAPRLTERVVGSATNVLYCPRCDGLWLDEGELRQLLSESALDGESPHELALTLLKWARERALTDDPEIDCPLCGRPTSRHEWKQSQVMIDRCLDCQGLWLDGGELDKLERYFTTFG